METEIVEEEKELVRQIKTLDIDIFNLRQVTYKKEEKKTWLMIKYDKLQRKRIEAANTKKINKKILSSPIINKLQRNTGLTIRELQKAFILLENQ